MTKNNDRGLSPQEVLRLINLEKVCVEDGSRSLHESKFTCDMTSTNGREIFQLDFSRGKIDLRYKMQTRHNTIYSLLRLDIGSSTYHDNPRVHIECEEDDPFYSVHKEYIGYHFAVGEPHMHIFRDGFGDRWAYPIPAEFENIENLNSTFEAFMKFSNIIKGPRTYKGIEDYGPRR